MKTGVKYITTTEAAERLDVDRRTILNNTEKLGAYKKLGRWLVAEHLVEQHLPPRIDGETE
jgi:predicted DNA-binding protein (UPF0251 family)